MKTLLPEINSADKRFHNGNPTTGEQGTRVTDTWLNDVQDRVRDVQAEAHYVLTKAGFTPKAETQTQLYQAIVKIIGDNRRSATTTQKGEVQLTSDTGLDSETLGLTAKAGKILSQAINSVRLALNNYIPLKNRSSAVNSNDENNVATSKAVKTAYDKGVEALNKANQVDAATLKKNGNQSINGVLKAENVGNAWAAYKFGAKQGEWQLEVHPDSHTAGNRRFNMLWSPTGGNRVYLSFPNIGDGGETVAYQSWVNTELQKVQSVANSANTNANSRASKRALTSDDLNNITASGIYGQNANVNATPQRHYPIQQAGMLLVTEYSGYGAQQLYAPFNAGYLYARGRNASNGWDDWKRIDGLDKVSKSGDTMTGNLTINHGEPRVHGNRNNTNNWYVGLPNGTSNNLHLHSYANNTSLVLESDKISTTKPVFSAGNRTAVSLSGHNIQFRWNNNGNLDLKIDNTELGQLHYTNQRYAVVTANNGDYAGLHIQRKGTSGNFWARAEALPDRRWKFVTEGGASVFMQNKSGTLALLEDIRKERLIWSGSSTQSITVNVGVTSGILLILLRTRGRQMWHCISIEHCNNTVIGFTEYGGENADKDYSNTALVTRNGSNITIGASRWAEVNKVILLGA